MRTRDELQQQIRLEQEHWRAPVDEVGRDRMERPGPMGERNTMRISFGVPEDVNFLTQADRHATPQVIREKIERGEIIVLYSQEQQAGYLRYGYFWDAIPFMNALWVREERRGQGLGTQLIGFWEEEMRRRGHDTVMTSTLANERAQHLYRKLGYEDCGALLMPDEPVEVLFLKRLGDDATH